MLAGKAAHVHLVYRAELAEMIRKVFPREVPEFDREKYNMYVAGGRNRPPRTEQLRRKKYSPKLGQANYRSMRPPGCWHNWPVRLLRNPLIAKGGMADGIGEGAGSNRGNRSGLIRLIPKAFLREENSDMNDAQKTVLGWAAVAVVASIVFCPYVVTDINTYPSFTAGVPSTESRTTSTEYGWVWDAPRNSSLDFGRLAMEWVQS